MDKSRKGQIGKLKIFPTKTQYSEEIFHPKVLLKLNLENPTVQE